MLQVSGGEILDFSAIKGILKIDVLTQAKKCLYQEMA